MRPIHHKTILRLAGRAIALVLLGAVVVPTAVAAPPPDIPERLDAATVQRLIATIEEDQNATILKVGYFMRRGAPGALPAREGMKVLKAAIAKEPTSSRRWFVLQAVRGFAGFRIGADTKSDAYTAYDELLTHAPDAEKIEATDVVHQAIDDLVATLPTSWGVRLLDNDTTARSLLLKALSVRLNFLKSHTQAQESANWHAALRVTGGDALTKQAVEGTLEGAAPSFALLRLAVQIFQSDDREHALSLLREAKPLLPRHDPAQVEWFYPTFVKLLRDNKQFPEALVAQQEYVKLTKVDYAGLIEAAHRANDPEIIEATVDALSQPEANEIEIIGAAQALAGLKSGQPPTYPYAKAARALLIGYLNAKRTRSIAAELQTRFVLGQWFFNEGNGSLTRASWPRRRKSSAPKISLNPCPQARHEVIGP